jgi:hypothetical protein
MGRRTATSAPAARYLIRHTISLSDGNSNEVPTSAPAARTTSTLSRGLRQADKRRRRGGRRRRTAGGRGRAVRFGRRVCDPRPGGATATAAGKRDKEVRGLPGEVQQLRPAQRADSALVWGLREGARRVGQLPSLLELGGGSQSAGRRSHSSASTRSRRTGVEVRHVYYTS